MDCAQATGKYRNLLKVISSYKTTGIAFSGGIDSTFLVYAALQALGANNVAVFTVSSCLQVEGGADEVKKFFVKQFGSKVSMYVIKTDPLAWDEFIMNTPIRCYQCKKKMYEEIIKVVCKNDISKNNIVLCDGTNFSDLSENRPGYKAIQEHNIATPLADVKLTKTEIRYLAREHHLTNWDLLSDSCLATRIETNIPITLTLLKKIEAGENFLKDMGFSGVRARHKGNLVIIQVVNEDFLELIQSVGVREKVVSFFKMLGYKEIALDLVRRTE